MLADGEDGGGAAVGECRRMNLMINIYINLVPEGKLLSVFLCRLEVA